MFKMLATDFTAGIAVLHHVLVHPLEKHWPVLIVSHAAIFLAALYSLFPLRFHKWDPWGDSATKKHWRRFRQKGDVQTVRYRPQIAPFDQPTITKTIYVCIYIMVEPGWRSRYSDSLRAVRSGDRIPVKAKFSTLIQTGSEAHPASCTMYTRSFPGVKATGVCCWPPTPIYCADVHEKE